MKSSRIAALAGVASLLFGAGAGVGRESEGARTNSVLLNGRWEFAPGRSDEDGSPPAGQAQLGWREVQLPGPFMRYSAEAANQTRSVWARRTFNVSASQARGLAVLRWNRIACGAVAFINGKKVGENEPTGPYQVIVPPGVLRAGENQIVLQVRGAAGVRKSRSGHALIPAGFGVGMPEVTDDVWIDFAESAYLKWVLAIPDLANSRVKIRATPAGLERLEGLEIRAQVRPVPHGPVLGQGRAPASVVPSADPLGGEHFFVEVPMPGFQPWTYEQRPLYLASVKLAQGGRILDEVSFRFGMREVAVKDRNYKLNNRNLWLRGSNLVFEWNWGDTITGKEQDYLVTEAREMSLNSFRTHTQPPPRRWCDIGDEHGTMFLAEFPVLYNYADYKFTPEEYEIWHRNVLTDSAGWMARLWNHPSVIMWVLSNESRVDNSWEEGPFQDFVKALDPTRPTLRTGTTGTRENYDVHACGNITETDEGNLQPQIAGWIKEAGERAVTCTEYMNYFGHPRTQWTGVDDAVANAIAVAQIGAEHTEAMRRARLDGIWPYMYAGWTRTRLAARVRETGKGSAVWKANFAAPESAAWHSSLSPVLASLDLFDANYLPGQKVTTPLYLINDSWHDAKIHVDLLLTRQCPELIPEAECFDNPVSKWSFDFSLKADSVERTPVTWNLPEAEGCYWLTARVTGMGGRPVLSQRSVHSVAPAAPAGGMKGREFLILGAGRATPPFFSYHGLLTLSNAAAIDPTNSVVVIWDASRLSPEEKNQSRTETLRNFVHSGGKMVVLSSPSWNWPELCDIRIGRSARFSRVFGHGVAGAVLPGIDAQWLVRWNGLPGTIGLAPLEGPAMEQAQKLLWAKEPGTTIMASVPAAGGGHILFAQLDLKGRLDRSGDNYDPVAERTLMSLLAGPKPAGGEVLNYFPSPESQGGWRRLSQPEDIRTLGGMEPGKLGELRKWLLESDTRDFAAVVIRHGYVVLQVERNNSAATDSRRVASVSKAVCATVLAIASEQSQQNKTPRKMTFDDRAFDFIPWAQPLSDPRKATITVKQLLNHTSGICPESTGAPNDGSWEYILGHSGDPRTEKLAFDPGKGCGYSTHALAHAALVCEAVTGKPYDEFAIEALFKPLGIEHWWFQYYDGAIGRHPSHGLGMPARDLARIGYCMLREGRWHKQQIVPRWFVEQTGLPASDVKTPELRWKLNPEVFSLGWELPARHWRDSGRSAEGIPADARSKPGSGGQLIAFVPSLDLVITRQTGASGDWHYEEYLRRACAAVLKSR